MMELIHRRSKPFSVENPYRTKRPSTSKIIFLSCEGSETEEEYIELMNLKEKKNRFTNFQNILRMNFGLLQMWMII